MAIKNAGYNKKTFRPGFFRPFLASLLLCAVLAALSPLPAECATVKHFQVSDGLVSDTITCLAVDKNGTLWAGSIDGISRYDGKKWEKFTVESGCLKDNSVWAVGVDETPSSSKVWFGTGFGIAIYENGHWTHYVGPFENPATKKREEGNCPLESNVVNRIFVAKNSKSAKNNVYIVAGGKLYKFNGDKWSTFEFPKDILKTASITCIYARGDDQVWLGTSGEGLVEFNTAQMKITTYTRKEGLPSDFVTAVFVGNDGRIWVGSESGLAVIEGGAATVFNYRNSKLVSDYVTVIRAGYFDNLVIATDKGMNLSDGKTFLPQPTSLSALNGKFIWDMTYSAAAGQDYSQLWIGTRGFGLFLYQTPRDATANIQEDQTKIAIQHFNSKNYDASVIAWDEVLKIDPDNKDAMIYKAKCYLNLGKKDDAKKTLGVVIEKHPNQKDAIMLLGEVFERSADLAGALKTYEKLASQYPKEAEGYLLCAQIHARMSNNDEAISNYTKALSINPELPSIYKGLAHVFMARGDLQKSLDISMQLQYKKPDDNENNVFIGRVLATMQKFDRAEEELKKVLADDPGNPAAKSALGYVYMETGKLADAEKLLTEAISRDFKDASAHATLALVHIENNNIASANDEINNARTFNSYEITLLYAQGRLYELEGKFDEAVRNYHGAIGGGYNTANVHYRIANSLKSLEKYDEALREYQQVLSMDPSFKKADDVKWMISKLSMPTDEELGTTGSTAATTSTTTAATSTTGSSTGGASTGTTTKPTLDDLDF